MQWFESRMNSAKMSPWEFAPGNFVAYNAVCLFV